ncbi:hypothetical protein KI688_000724 [Linnemannia hyalina]|uniref:Uncharacterized protein n=1 Tax=Linnemannia hyalina TaxID=64524 RepID=A0A9P7Y6M3_9FUNG|nr:hypothetical protein KI688_000724 [Linnemannia hyalina]
MRSFIKCASLAVLASLLTLTMLSLMSKTTTAFTFAMANPVGDEPLAYDGSLSALATEAEDLNPRADGTDAARLFCRPGYRRCGFFGHSAEGPGIDAPPPPPENRTDPIEAPGGGAPPTAPEAPIEGK